MLRNNGALSVSLACGIENKFLQKKQNAQKGPTGSILATLGPPLTTEVYMLVKRLDTVNGLTNGNLKVNCHCI
jgi:hypothetical protein